MLASCQAGAWAFIEVWFHDCVYSIGDCTGFTLGLAAIGLWITAQIPQFLDNIKNQSAEALSVWFLAQWFLGDTLNLLGCLMSGEQLPTTTALAMYFVLSDVVMLTQYVYFGALQRHNQRLALRAQSRKARRPHHHHHHLHRSSGVVGLMSDGTVRSPPPKAGAASFSHSPRPTVSQRQPQHPQLQRQQHQQHQPQLQPQQEQEQEQQHSNGTEASPRRCPSASGMVVATAAAGSALSLLALGALMARSPGPGWRGMLSGAGASMGIHMHPGNGEYVLLHIGMAQRHDRGAWGAGAGHEDDYGSDDDLPWWQDTDEIMKVLGAVFGFCSTGLYLSSRLSQIYKNWSRKSAEGLSVVMFLFTISANMCTGTSILLRLKSLEAFQAQLPWILGAYGTVGLDVFIARQAVLYNRAHTQVPAGQDPERGMGASPSVESTNPLLQPLADE